MNTQTVIVLVLISSCQTNGSVRLKHLHKRTFHTTTQTCVYLTFNYSIQEHFIEVYRICSISTSYHDKTEFWLAEYIFRERTLIELFLHLLLLTLSPKILTNFLFMKKHRQLFEKNMRMRCMLLVIPQEVRTFYFIIFTINKQID